MALTSRPAPSWLNRAASIGLALPCVVPRDWIAPPDHETADGELLDDEYNEEDDERTAMLRRDSTRRATVSEVPVNAWENEDNAGGGVRHSPPRAEGPRLVSLKDTSGREMPASERAPLPKRT
jgi:deubiquitinase DESI2